MSDMMSSMNGEKYCLIYITKQNFKGSS